MSDDLISRQELLKLPRRKGYAVNGWEEYIRVSDVKELSSVQPDIDEFLRNKSPKEHREILHWIACHYYPKDSKEVLQAVSNLIRPDMRGDAVNEMMTFPDTWEEFEKSYGFTDNEEVYTNGARLIPSFRVKQWLDHLLSVQPQKGKWIKDNPHSEIYRYACSECHAHHRARYDFCPSCGADMRSEAREYLEYGKLIAKGIAQGLRGDSNEN